MPPPSYSDLDKAAKDLFNKGYTQGFLKVDSTITTSSTGNVEFQTAASHNLISQKMSGHLSIKYKVPQYGLIITEKWNSDNKLSTVLEMKDQFVKGLKLTLDSSYIPHSATRGSVLKTEWVSDLMKLNADMTLSSGPILALASVVCRQNWYFGAQTKYNLSTNELKNSNAAISRITPDYTIHAYINDGRELGASIYHKVYKNFEMGTQLSWVVGDQSARFGLASKYIANDDVTFRAKVDSSSQVTLAATHSLGSFVKLTLSTQFSLLNLQLNNKIGLGLEYNSK